MGQISVLGKEGDTRLIWDKTKPAEVQAAREMFDSLKAKGYLAFSVVEKAVGDKGEQLTKFDPNAEKIIMAAAMQGGMDHKLPIVPLAAQERTTDQIINGDFKWCRARLLHALAGAAEQGVLQDVIDELMSTPIEAKQIFPTVGEWEPVALEEADGHMVARWLIDAMEQTGWMKDGKHLGAR